MKERWEIAPFRRRVGALAINAVCSLLIGKIVFLVLGLDPAIEMKWTNGVFSWTWRDGTAFLLTWLALFIGYDAFLAGGPGKLVFGLRIVDISGKKLSFTQAVLRNLVKAVDLYSFGAFALADPFTRSLSDRLSGSLVVRKELRLPSAAPSLPKNPRDRAVVSKVLLGLAAVWACFLLYGFARWIHVSRVTETTWNALQQAIERKKPDEVRKLFAREMVASQPASFFDDWLEKSPEPAALSLAGGAEFNHWQQVGDRILAQGKTSTLLLVKEGDEWKLQGVRTTPQP
jgi:uncharacterized RDD family membrane protein YckC